MVQPDGATVEEVVPHIHHLARQRCHDGRAGGGGNVHAAVRIARLAVEDAAQAEAAGAAPGAGLAHLQVPRLRCRAAEQGHDGLLVRPFALVACQVLGREVDGLGRDLQLLLGVALVAHGIVHGLGAVVAVHGDRVHAQLGRQRNADQGRPLDHVAHHQHRHAFRRGDLRSKGRRAQRQAGHAARDAAVQGEPGGVGRGCGPGGQGGAQAQLAQCGQVVASLHERFRNCGSHRCIVACLRWGAGQSRARPRQRGDGGGLPSP